jgi:hypothetical protein
VVVAQKQPYSFFGHNRFDLTPFKSPQTFDDQSPSAPPKKQSSEPFPFHDKSKLIEAAPVCDPSNQQAGVTVAATTTTNTIEKGVASKFQAPKPEPLVPGNYWFRGTHPYGLCGAAAAPGYIAIKQDPGTPIKAETCECELPRMFNFC